MPGPESQSPVFPSYHSPTFDSDVNGGLELDGAGVVASEAESAEYYHSLNDSQPDKGEAGYGGAAGLVGAYGASPPSRQRQQKGGAKKQAAQDEEQRQQLDAEDEAERTRELLAELQAPSDSQPAARAATADDEAADDEQKASTARGSTATAAAHATKRHTAATKSGRGQQPSPQQRAEEAEAEKQPEIAPSVGKRLKSSMLATASGNGASEQTAGRRTIADQQRAEDRQGSERQAGKPQRGRRQKAAEEDGEDVQQPARETMDAATEHKQPTDAAVEQDPFDFAAARAVEDGESEQQPQPAAAKKGKTAVGRPKKKADKKKPAADGRDAVAEEAAVRDEDEQEVPNGPLADSDDAGGEPVRHSSQQPRPLVHAARKSQPKADRAINKAATAPEERAQATAPPEEDSHVFSFPSAADESDTNRQPIKPSKPAGASKTAATGGKKGKGKSKKQAAEDAETPAQRADVADELVDGGDVAAAPSAITAESHLDSYAPTSPPSAKFRQRRADQERQRARKQRMDDEQRMVEEDGQLHSDGTSNAGDQQAEGKMHTEEEDEDEIDLRGAPAAKRTKDEKSALLPKQKKRSPASTKPKKGTQKKPQKAPQQKLLEDGEAELEPVEQRDPQGQQADEEASEQDAHHPRAEQTADDGAEQQQEAESDVVSELEERAQEVDHYDFSSSGAEEPKAAKQKKRAAASTKRREPAASKPSKKMPTASRGKRKRSSGAEGELTDVFDTAAREIGLVTDSDDSNRRTTIPVTADAEREVDDMLAEPAVFARLPKKRRAGRSSTHSRGAAAATADSGGAAVRQDALASLVACIDSLHDGVKLQVQGVVERVHTALQQHVQDVDAITAELDRHKDSHDNQEITEFAGRAMACLKQNAQLKDKVKRLQGSAEKAVGQALSKQLNALQTAIDRVKHETEHHSKEARKALLGNVKAGFKPLLKMAASQHTTVQLHSSD